MKIIDADMSIEKIKSLPIELDAETIQRCIEVLSNMSPAQPVDKAYLCDWYINSVTESEPIWTEAHISELMGDFYIIPKRGEQE